MKKRADGCCPGVQPEDLVARVLHEMTAPCDLAVLRVRPLDENAVPALDIQQIDPRHE
jgi:hypothetical protein